jgi:hypothetical protein
MKTPPNRTHEVMDELCALRQLGTFYTAGLLGRWRPLCGHLRHARLANSQSYWLRRSSRNWLANRLAIIPSPS